MTSDNRRQAMTTMMRASNRAQVSPRPHAPTVRVVDPTGTPCRGADPDIFFAESPAGVEAAKALCLDCPMQLRCLTEAIERREPCGVWGGELFAEGAIVPRKRPRGRPRKHDAERDAVWFAQHAELLQQTGAVA
jgi:WhiB family redox-sensing transcriptional regulator